MPAPVEILRLAQAVENFQARAPKNLPNGVMDKLGEVMAELGAVDASGVNDDTPGRREARRLAPGTEGTGESIRKAAKGRDGPSPGQREARNLSAEIAKAAASISERVNG